MSLCCLRDRAPDGEEHGSKPRAKSQKTITETSYAAQDQVAGRVAYSRRTLSSYSPSPSMTEAEKVAPLNR